MPVTDQETTRQPLASNPFTIVVLLAITAVLSWQGSQYVGEQNRIRVENIELKTRNAELTKELDKCSSRPGFRPGSPIGSTPLGATDPTPAGN